MVGMSSFDGIFWDVSPCKISTKSVKRLPRKLNFFFKKDSGMKLFFNYMSMTIPWMQEKAGCRFSGHICSGLWCIWVSNPHGKPWRSVTFRNKSNKRNGCIRVTRCPQDTYVWMVRGAGATKLELWGWSHRKAYFAWFFLRTLTEYNHANGAGNSAGNRQIGSLNHIKNTFFHAKFSNYLIQTWYYIVW